MQPIFIVRSSLSQTYLGYTLAITNSTNPADAANYYLPTIRMLSGARPSCSYCTRSLFNVYYQFSSNATLQISKNYLEAAQVVNLNCGPGYVNTTYPEKLVSLASRMSEKPPWWIASVWTGVLGMALWLICWHFYFISSILLGEDHISGGIFLIHNAMDKH